MKIFFYKDNPTNYVLDPIPSELEKHQFYEKEIDENQSAIALMYDPKNDIISINHDYYWDQTEQKKQSLLAEATEAIAPLQDAVDLGMATDKEIVSLKKWKEYRVLLNRVDTSTAPDIDWPVKPE